MLCSPFQAASNKIYVPSLTSLITALNGLELLKIQPVKEKNPVHSF